MQGVILRWEWLTGPEEDRVTREIATSSDRETGQDDVPPLKPYFAGWWNTRVGISSHPMHVVVDLPGGTAVGTYRAGMNTAGAFQGKLSQGGRVWEGFWTEGRPSRDAPTMPEGERGGRFRVSVTEDGVDGFLGCYNLDGKANVNPPRPGPQPYPHPWPRPEPWPHPHRHPHPHPDPGPHLVHTHTPTHIPTQDHTRTRDQAPIQDQALIQDRVPTQDRALIRGRNRNPNLSPSRNQRSRTRPA